MSQSAQSQTNTNTSDDDKKLIPYSHGFFDKDEATSRMRKAYLKRMCAGWPDSFGLLAYPKPEILMGVALIGVLIWSVVVSCVSQRTFKLASRTPRRYIGVLTGAPQMGYII
jgi:hypothetical protein